LWLFVVVVVVVAVTPSTFFLVRSGQKLSNRLYFHVFVKLSEQETPEYRPMFFATRKPKTSQNHSIYLCFAFGSKNHRICSIVWPEPGKSTGIYAVFSMLQEVAFQCQSDKNIVNGSVLAKNKQQKSTRNCPKWTFQTLPC